MWHDRKKVWQAIEPLFNRSRSGPYHVYKYINFKGDSKMIMMFKVRVVKASP